MGKTPRICVLAMASCLGAYAQTVAGFGAARGTVRDVYGDGLPDTTVLIYNDHNGLRRTMTATDDGLFTAPELPPAEGYAIKVSRTGYQDWNYKDFDISVGTVVDFAITLDQESTSSKVSNPSGFVSAVEETKNNISTVISRRQLDNLPADTRALDPFVPLAPAVTQVRNSGTLVFLGEPSTNAFYTDGANTTNTYYYQTPLIAPQLNPDGVQDMQVMSTGAPADFGWAMGGTMNTATQSGSNTLHGTAFGYLVNSSWLSSLRFAPGFHPDDKQRQYGADLGGRIPTVIGGKLFFFGNVQRTTLDSQGINELSNPLLAGPYGTGLAANCKASAAQCAAAINFLNPELNRVISRSMSAINGLVRIDYRRSDRNAFSVEANALHNNSPNGLNTDAVSPNGGLLAGNGNYIDETRYVKGAWTWALSSVTTNNLSASLYRDRFTDTYNHSLFPNQTGGLALNIAGTPVGGNPAIPSTLTETRDDVTDSFTFATGAHAIRLGAEFARNRDAMSQLYNGAGSYTYPSLTAFALDLTPIGAPRNYTLFEQTVGEPVTNIRATQIAAFAQDEWRASRRLRLTLGVRWEKTKFPAPVNFNTSYYQTATIASPSTDFGPRAGGTYLLNDRTVIRAGIGFYYEPFVGQLMRSLYSETGVLQSTLTGTPTQTGSLVFPKIVANLSSVPAGMQDIVYGSNKFRNPYAQVGTIGIERRVDRRTAVAVTYIDTRGQRFWTATDQNLTGPTSLAPTYGFETYTIDNAGGTSSGTFVTPIYTLQTTNGTTSGKSDFNSAHVYQLSNAGSSKYHAVTAQVREQMLYGLSAQLSYTWSHAIDDVSGPPIVGGVVPASVLPGDFRGDQGNSNFDQRNRVVINWTWAPTFIKNNSIPARFFINGWRISGIATIASSLPQTPLLLMNGQQFSGVNMIYLTSLNGAGGWGRVPFQAVNSIPIGRESNIDASITRTLPFTERIHGALTFEAFNAFNHQYTTGVNTIEYTATGGVLHPVDGFGAPNAAYGTPFGTNARFLQVAFRISF